MRSHNYPIITVLVLMLVALMVGFRHQLAEAATAAKVVMSRGTLTVKSGGTQTVDSGGTLTVNGTTNLVKGASTGYALARGSTSVTGTALINTGLTTIVAMSGSVRSASASAVCVSFLPSNGANATATVYSMTSASNNAFITSSAAKTVDWIAIGTK
jgi:hypothetical protein